MIGETLTGLSEAVTNWDRVKKRGMVMGGAVDVQ